MKISIGLLYFIVRPIESMMSLLYERTREWRATVHAWQLYRKSQMLKCYVFFPLHLAFLPLKADSTSPCSHRMSKGPLSCRLSKKEWKGD